MSVLIGMTPYATLHQENRPELPLAQLALTNDPAFPFALVVHEEFLTRREAADLATRLTDMLIKHPQPMARQQEYDRASEQA